MHSDWENLLVLDGVTMVVDDKLGFWVKFVVRHGRSTSSAPHGMSYSLTLHNRSGQRILGFDNAHQVGHPGPSDHWHRNAGDPGRRYVFETPNKLLSDFWREVDRVVKEHGDG